MLTFVDAGILILGSRGNAEISTRALAVLDDPRRVFVASPFLKLEVLPKPSYFRRTDEVAFYETFFDAVSLGACAHELEACAHGLEACAHALEAQAHDLEPRARDLEPRAHDLEPRAHALEARTHPLGARSHR